MRCAICNGLGDVKVAGHGVFCDGCMTKALRLLKRVESGDAVVIEKRDGEWPDCVDPRYHNQDEWSFHGRSGRSVQAATFEQAAAAWNGGAE